MYNELFSIGPFTVYGYGLMIAIAIIAAYVTTEIRAKKYKMAQELIFSLVAWCAVGGLAGAKLLYIIIELPNIIESENFLYDIATGFVVYGGIISGIITGYIFCKVKKLKFLDYFDLGMPSIAIAQGFGRIGCFLAGCCYGVETDSCIGITFHNSQFAPNDVSLVPTQLLSSGLNFIHFLILIIFAKRKKASGQVAALYLILYSSGRYVMEMFRGDLDRGSVGQFSTSQFISIFLFVIGVALFIACTIYAKKHPVISPAFGETDDVTDDSDILDNTDDIFVADTDSDNTVVNDDTDNDVVIDSTDDTVTDNSDDVADVDNVDTTVSDDSISDDNSSDNI